jgi:hypothetical protein
MRSWVIGACEYDVLTRSWCLRKRMTQLEMVFAHTYEVSEFPELPGSGWGKTPVHYFPRTQTRPEHDGIWIKVVPSTGLPWVGVFDFGYGVPPAISAILSAPNPGVLCVVSAGAGYLVKSDEPDAWEKLDIFPVTGVRAIPECELLVFATFHKLAALGPNGFAWESPRLCWDELCIARADSEHIEGFGYDPTSSPTKMSFSLETRTGRSLLPAPQSIDGKPVW